MTLDESLSIIEKHVPGLDKEDNIEVSVKLIAEAFINYQSKLDLITEVFEILLDSNLPMNVKHELKVTLEKIKQ